MQIFGGLKPVDWGERDDLIALLEDAPHPVELDTFRSRRFAPKKLRHNEDDWPLSCGATPDVADPAAVGEALRPRRLLDSFGADDGCPGAMSPTGLRAALGLS